MSVPTTNVPIERGMILLQREEASAALPVRFRLWAVSTVRRTARGSSVKLLLWSPGCLAEATATFPDGLVREPWQVFTLSQRDLQLVYDRHAEAADHAEA